MNADINEIFFTNSGFQKAAFQFEEKRKFFFVATNDTIKIFGSQERENLLMSSKTFSDFSRTMETKLTLASHTQKRKRWVWVRVFVWVCVCVYARVCECERGKEIGDERGVRKGQWREKERKRERERERERESERLSQLCACWFVGLLVSEKGKMCVRGKENVCEEMSEWESHCFNAMSAWGCESACGRMWVLELVCLCSK